MSQRIRTVRNRHLILHNAVGGHGRRLLIRLVDEFCILHCLFEQHCDRMNRSAIVFSFGRPGCIAVAELDKSCELVGLQLCKPLI
ncbi:MAG: hypothetical protein EA377_00295 [Phycisphaerales bacterium]|nr:MAG: hypothetical protein EA377_00295 [Phycisphaerales bacterium]